MNKIQSLRGMHDLLPEDSKLWQTIEATIEEVLASYGYGEIRLPIVEKTELFTRSIGDITDIVEKEMYTFEDRNGESISMRPEGTAGCVRACLQNGLFDQTRKLWYRGPMFRYERPQKGRTRQFHQVGVEIFGLAGPDIDAELILLTSRLWRELGIDDAVTLELNSLGGDESRKQHREALVEYFTIHQSELDEDSKRRLNSNPLRILDSKNPALQSLINTAPRLADFYDAESSEHFQQLCGLLDAAGVRYRVNPRLVRGLDYYSKTVFEWVTTELGAQGTVCGGGRYDALVQMLGGRTTPALGFGLGLERLVLLVQQINPELADHRANLGIYIVVDPSLIGEGLRLAEQIRAALPHLSVVLNMGGGSFKSQFKKADKSGAEIALVLGEQEHDAKRVGLKQLRGSDEGFAQQETIDESALIERLRCL